MTKIDILVDAVPVEVSVIAATFDRVNGYERDIIKYPRIHVKAILAVRGIRYLVDADYRVTEELSCKDGLRVGPDHDSVYDAPTFTRESSGKGVEYRTPTHAALTRTVDAAVRHFMVLEPEWETESNRLAWAMRAQRLDHEIERAREQLAALETRRDAALLLAR